jgi:glycosyltransferase involved in cell wall biosynthesis
MIAGPDPLASTSRKPRLLWASVYCLLDTSSGASMSARQMLLQLVQQGYEVSLVGATVFDHERGTAGLTGQWSQVQTNRGRLVALTDGPLEHRLYVTASTQRGLMTSTEESAWFALYQRALRQFRPDVVFYYGGKPLDWLIPAEARARGIPAVFYLANGNYSDTRWCRDVDLVLTNSQASADLYGRTLGLRPVPVGTFIDPARVVALQRTPRHVLFVNPTLEKGVVLVVRLAMLLEQRRPDIVFEVVESRGKWAEILRTVSGAIGAPRESLANVVVTPNSADMRPIYARARLLLAPSLWWESSGRVLVEAMLNGIPAIYTEQGGMPEVVQDGGVAFKLDAVFHQKPFTRVPTAELLEPLLQRLEMLFDDEALYNQLAARARRVGQTRHSLQVSTPRLLQALQPLTALRAGDADPATALRACHKQGLE